MSFTTKLYGKVITPLSYYVKGDLRSKYFKKYKRNLKKSRLDIEGYQLERLKKLIQHAYATVPYYRTLFEENKIKPEDIKTLDDFKKIPLIDKKMVLLNIDRLKSNKKYELIKHFSGGSTGNKSLIYKDKRYHELSYGVWMRDLYSVGIEPGMKSAWIWGDTLQNQPLIKKLLHKLSFKLNRRIMFNVFKFTDENLKDWLEQEFNKFKPDYIYGYAGVIYNIAKFVKKNSIQLHHVKKIITTSERLEHRKFIESVFKCPVIDQYGCSEVTIIAIENNNKIMHSADDFVLVEVNGNNEVLLTPLESYGMPLLRYQVGDVGWVRKTKKNRTKHPFKEFNIIIGRIYEFLINKNHEKISGGLIKQQVEDENLSIREWQLVQKSIDLVELNIVYDEFTTQKSVERLKKIVEKLLGCTQVKVNCLKSFPTEPNGKRVAFKCEIPGEHD